MEANVICSFSQSHHVSCENQIGKQEDEKCSHSRFKYEQLLNICIYVINNVTKGSPYTMITSERQNMMTLSISLYFSVTY